MASLGFLKPDYTNNVKYQQNRLLKRFNKDVLGKEFFSYIPPVTTLLGLTA